MSEEYRSSLIAWISTFDIHIDSMNQLKDGIIISLSSVSLSLSILLVLLVSLLLSSPLLLSLS